MPIVAAPPPKPLLVYDGDCGFCKLWIARWREITAGRVDYAPLQEAAARFPEIPRADFEQAVKFIEPDGRWWSSAEAVFRSLGAGRSFAAGRWSYEHVPGFAPLAEAAYAFVASHRELAHKITSLLWGEDVRQPTYFRARDWFLRALGAIYLIAFLSLWVQVDGLIGAHGVAPLPEYLAAAKAQLGSHAPLVLPTLCWFGASNATLHFLCGAGAFLSVLLIVGIAPVFCLSLLFVGYLSLAIAGQDFLSFQWDILLLETGFLAIFLAPWRWRLRPNDSAPLSRVALFLLHFLLFKLMLMSGVVKLTSGDASWWNLTALDYHYWTQPLPTVVGWWAAQAPEWFLHFSTAFVLVVEILGAFLLWMPRRLRLLGAGLLVFLQVVIGLTGNYAFFNLLTIALCLLLVDDSVGRMRREGLRKRPAHWAPVFVLLATLPVNAMLIFSAFKPEANWPRPLGALYGWIAPFRIANGYGLFRVMTKERPEIVIEGSDDGKTWKPYEFKWKPGALDRMPGFVAPHQPRLDWQMWFAALGGDPRREPWFVGLIVRLSQNEPAVLGLLRANPFPEKPPRFLRADLYQYRFTTRAERDRTGAWWQREEPSTFLPAVSFR